MILNKLLLLLFVASSLFASDLSRQYEKMFLNKVLADYPFLEAKDIQITFENPDVFELKKGMVGIEFSFPENSDIVGTTILPIKYVNATGDIVKADSLKTEVSAKHYLVFTKKRLRKGHIIKKDDLDVRYVDLVGTYKNSFKSIDEVLGKEVRSTLGKSTVLSPLSVRDVPSVRRNEKISLIIRQNGLELKVRGLSLDDGYDGDIIRVRPEFGEKKVVEGKVLSENLAEIILNY